MILLFQFKPPLPHHLLSLPRVSSPALSFSASVIPDPSSTTCNFDTALASPDSHSVNIDSQSSVPAQVTSQDSSTGEIPPSVVSHQVPEELCFAIAPSINADGLLISIAVVSYISSSPPGIVADGLPSSLAVASIITSSPINVIADGSSHSIAVASDNFST